MKSRMNGWMVGVITVLLLFPCGILAEPGEAVQVGERSVTANQVGAVPNDFELLVRAAGNAPNVYGYSSLVTFVTYMGAGVTGLTSEMFHISTSPQSVPSNGTALVLDPERFIDWGEGRYSLAVKPFNDGEWKTGTYNMILAVDARPEYNAGGMTIVVLKNE